LRKRNADILAQSFSHIPALRVTRPPDYIEHAYYKYYVFIWPEYLKDDWNRDRIIEALNEKGIPCFSGSCSEVYLEKAFDGNGLRPAERLPVAKELGETSLMFLVHPTLTEENMEERADAVEQLMAEASL
jgi:dTDP-4-amino-4,6-dideoxygalactose transaminase